MPRVLNSTMIGRAQKSKNQVYIGRPSKWGNPFQIGIDGTREEVVQHYYDYLMDSPHLLRDLDELIGKDLVCWCAPYPCHGDILLKLAELKATPMEDLIARSSLGTPGAMALRQRTPKDVVDEIMKKIEENRE